MKVVIAEKPSVAKSIGEAIGANNRKNGYLEGNGYYVTWCVGHLIELVTAEKYNPAWKKWSYETLPIIPEKWSYEIKRNTRDQYQVLHSLLNSQDVNEVICATDAGREGELIFRLVYNQANCNKPVKRLWISSMEEKAILDGFKNLRDGSEYDDLYNAAVCRSQADWLVGINATRLFTVLYKHKLTVGRVQTPTLAMIVDREQKIQDFVKEKYYLAHISSNELDAVTKRIDEKNIVDKIAGACRNRQALVTSVKVETKKINPPRLYDLTTLQREANRLLGYTAQQTLDYTQSLYEKKLVTYPRTDSQYLTEDMQDSVCEIIGIINELFSYGILEIQPSGLARIINSKKVTDHHAIIPTKEISKLDLSKIPTGEGQLLKLIVDKLICATREEHIFESVKAELTCEGVSYVTSGKSIKQNGWKEIEDKLKNELNKKNKDREKIDKPLPVLEEGMIIENVATSISEHFTSPLKQYTEDTLLSAMENAGNEEISEEVERKGLGTPATRASIIEKLVEKGFIERKNKKLLPTDNGIKLITVLPDVVKSPLLTAEWENSLTLISKNEMQPEEFIAGIENMVKDLVVTYHEVGEHKGMFKENDREIIGICPKCGSNVYESKVNFYCENRECDFTLFKNNKYFSSMKKEITKGIAKSFLESGKANVTGLYSQKKDKKFNATIVMDSSGKYVQFSMEFTPYKKKK